MTRGCTPHLCAGTVMFSVFCFFLIIRAWSGNSRHRTHPCGQTHTPIFCHLPYKQLFAQEITILLVQGKPLVKDSAAGSTGRLYRYTSIPPRGTSGVLLVHLFALPLLVVVSASLSDARVRLADLWFPQILPGLFEVAITLLLPVF